MTHDDTPIEAVVFDLGNVFIEWSRELLYGQLIPDPNERSRFLDNILTAEVNLRLDRGERFDDVLAEVVAEHSDHADLVLAFKSGWVKTLGGVDSEMVEILESLAGRFPVYALTNWSAETFPIAQERFGWLDLFDGHVVSGRERVNKPEVAIYETLSRRYGHAPGSLWFTDDSQANVDAARSCGWRAELFIDAATVRRQLNELGVVVGPT